MDIIFTLLPVTISSDFQKISLSKALQVYKIHLAKDTPALRVDMVELQEAATDISLLDISG